MDTVMIDGEERPVEEVPTRCSDCGAGELDFEYCTNCLLKRLKTAAEENDTDFIREKLESRIFHAGTRGRTAQMSGGAERAEKKGTGIFDLTVWTSDDFRMDVRDLASWMNDEDGFNVTLDFCRNDDEFRKFCRVIIKER